MADLHPLVADAAEGRLPEWARAGERRRAHMARVSQLMDSWARELGLESDQCLRWRAAGLLHDALRDASADEIRSRVSPAEALALPDHVLHGPAAAELLRCSGVSDGELLMAVHHHTTGHCSFGSLGCALYVADLLEPGRPLGSWRNAFLDRLPWELKQVTHEVAERRLTRHIRHGGLLLATAVDFWNAIVSDDVPGALLTRDKPPFA